MKIIKKLVIPSAWLFLYLFIILAVLLTLEVTYNVSLTNPNANTDYYAETVVSGVFSKLFAPIKDASIFEFRADIKEIASALKSVKTVMYDQGFQDVGLSYDMASMSCSLSSFFVILALILIGILLLATIVLIIFGIVSSKNPKMLSEAEASGSINLLKSCNLLAFLPLFIYGCFWLPTVLTNMAIDKTVGGNSACQLGFAFKGMNPLIFAIVMAVVYFVGSYVINKIINKETN